MKVKTKYRIRAAWFRVATMFVFALPFIALVVFVWAWITHGMGTAWGAGIGIVTALFGWSGLPDLEEEYERCMHRYKNLGDN